MVESDDIFVLRKLIVFRLFINSNFEDSNRRRDDVIYDRIYEVNGAL